MHAKKCCGSTYLGFLCLLSVMTQTCDQGLNCGKSSVRNSLFTSIVRSLPQNESIAFIISAESRCYGEMISSYHNQHITNVINIQELISSAPPP